MKPRPPTPLVSCLVGAIAIAVALTGCSSRPVPSTSSPAADASGLLVATSGEVRSTRVDGTTAPFDTPAERIQTVVAAGGRVVVVGPDGRAWVASLDATPRVWTAVRASVAEAGSAPLIALSAAGDTLAAVRGDPQGPRFDLLLVALAGGVDRRIPVPRGLNGPPSWLSPTSLALDVIDAAGRSGIAAIDIGTGAVEDTIGPGLEVGASSDGRVVVVIDADGHARVGDTSSWRSARLETLTLLGDDAAPVERVAISADGQRVGLVRRLTDEPADVEIWLAGPTGWTRGAVLPRVGDGPVSIAWST